MPLLKLSYILPALLLLCSCKKERLYFQKIEVVESNTTSRLNKVQFINDTICIITGGERFHKAEMLRSTDGGYNWQSNTYPEVGKGIYEIQKSPAGTIYTFAFDGKILTSKDNGLTWEYREVGNWEFHVGMSFVNENKIVLVSRDGQKAGKIVITDSNMQVQKTTPFEFALNDVQMVNEQVGYIACYGAVLKTTDGGDTWNYLDIKGDNFNTVVCLSEDELWVCGYTGSIFHTTDGGDTWERLRNGNSITQPKYNLNDMVFTDASNGWAIGEKGLIIRTEDGGKSWQPYNKLTENSLLGIAICPNGDLLVVGEQGKIFRIHP